MTGIEKTKINVSLQRFFCQRNQCPVHAWACTKHMAEESSDAKLPTIWVDGEAEVGRAKENQGRRKLIKVRKKLEKSQSPKALFFSMFRGSGRSRSRLAKAAGAQPYREVRDEKCTPRGPESTVRS